MQLLAGQFRFLADEFYPENLNADLFVARCLKLK